MEFAVPFAGVILLMFLHADFFIQIIWIITWSVIRYKFVKTHVQQNHSEANK